MEKYGELKEALIEANYMLDQYKSPGHDTADKLIALSRDGQRERIRELEMQKKELQGQITSELKIFFE